MDIATDSIIRLKTPTITCLFYKKITNLTVVLKLFSVLTAQNIQKNQVKFDMPTNI